MSIEFNYLRQEAQARQFLMDKAGFKPEKVAVMTGSHVVSVLEKWMKENDFEELKPDDETIIIAPKNLLNQCITFER